MYFKSTKTKIKLLCIELTFVSRSVVLVCPKCIHREREGERERERERGERERVGERKREI